MNAEGAEGDAYAADLKLVTPTIELQQEYLEMIAEWQESGEKIIPFVLNEDPSDFETLISKLENQRQGIGLAEGIVPASTYWLLQNNKKMLGAVNIRHYLNELLEKFGGHIRMGIRPSERRKGYGAKMLGMALAISRNLGIMHVLVICDKDNLASSCTIRKNGGVLDSEEVKEDGTIVQRYWIDLDNEYS
jgi:predicted acetyltransferase